LDQGYSSAHLSGRSPHSDVLQASPQHSTRPSCSPRAPSAPHSPTPRTATGSPQPHGPQHPFSPTTHSPYLGSPQPRLQAPGHTPRAGPSSPVRGRTASPLPSGPAPRLPPPCLASPQRSALGARRPPRWPRPAHAGGWGGGRSAQLPAGSRPPQLRPRSPPGLGPLLCVSFGHSGAEVTTVAVEGGGREGVLGRAQGQGEGASPSLCGAEGGS
jgi:hypothetical protein